MVHLASNNSLSYLNRFTQEQIQPNALDLRVESLREIDDTPFLIDEEKKEHRGSHPVSTKDGYWQLEAGKRYEVIFEGVIDIKEGEAGWVITRSTLNRNGITITSGLYDSGFQNYVGGVMHIGCGKARVQKGARVAQFIYIEAETDSMYDGDYNAV